MSGEGFEMPPLRSLDDFLLSSARFQLPQFKDLEKWGNRVANNLLYYQSNYFAMALAVFLLVGLMNPLKFLCGTFAIAIAFAIFIYTTNASRAATQFKKDHPVVGVIITLGAGYLIVHLLGSVLVFLFGILLPIALIFIHSSLRLRNLKNKLSNKIEIVGLKRSPMGIFLETLEGTQLPGDPKQFHTEKSFLGLYDFGQSKKL